jgi:hypothetical protein
MAPLWALRDGAASWDQAFRGGLGQAGIESVQVGAGATARKGHEEADSFSTGLE